MGLQHHEPGNLNRYWYNYKSVCHFDRNVDAVGHDFFWLGGNLSLYFSLRKTAEKRRENGKLTLEKALLVGWDATLRSFAALSQNWLR